MKNRPQSSIVKQDSGNRRATSSVKKPMLQNLPPGLSGRNIPNQDQNSVSNKGMSGRVSGGSTQA